VPHSESDEVHTTNPKEARDCVSLYSTDPQSLFHYPPTHKQRSHPLFQTTTMRLSDGDPSRAPSQDPRDNVLLRILMMYLQR
jgi:hypothetical protein